MVNKTEWQALGNRVEKRLIRALDVLSTLVFDSVLLLGGFLSLRLAELLPGAHSWLFDAARTISAWAFVLLYLIWVGKDLVEFWKEK